MKRETIKEKTRGNQKETEATIARQSEGNNEGVVNDMKETTTKRNRRSAKKLEIDKFNDFNLPAPGMMGSQGFMGAQGFMGGFAPQFQPPDFNTNILKGYIDNTYVGNSYADSSINTIIDNNIKIEFQELNNIKHVLEKIYVQKDSNRNANLIIMIKEYHSDMFDNNDFAGITIAIAIPLVLNSEMFKGKMLLNQFTGFGITSVSANEVISKLKELFEVDITLV